MEHYKISKLLDNSTESNIVTRKWTDINDLSGGQYCVHENIKFKTPMLRSDLGDYSGTYIVLKGTITIEGTDNANKRNKNLRE